MKFKTKFGLFALFSSTVACVSAIPEGKTIEVVILETTDIHTNILPYDYYKDTPAPGYGLSKIATLVEDERKQNPQAFLIDNGDLLQGNPLGDLYGKVTPPKAGETHPMHRIMKAMRYDVSNLGNHDFDFGLGFLGQAKSTAGFPVISANVFYAGKEGAADLSRPWTQPYAIVEKDIDGAKVRVAFVGVVPPQVTQWDRSALKDAVVTIDQVEAVKRILPEVRAQADLVAVISHSGPAPLLTGPLEENAADDIARLEGVDAVFMGHMHQEFPGGKPFQGLEKHGIDNAKGTIWGKPAVMPGTWGSHLGVVRFSLKRTAGKWVIASQKSELRSVKEVASSPSIEALAKDWHEKTLASVREAVGRSETPVQTWFARVTPTLAVDVVNDAQTWYVKEQLRGTPHEKLPVLSASAPFKAGFNNEYTFFPAGPLAVKHIADLYVYPNTLKAVKINGKILKAWLEKSSENFIQVDPNSTGEVNIINPAFPSYNFDIISGVNWQFDITKPTGSRVVGLSFAGKPVEETQEFVVATNNYRASGGGNFPGLDGKNIILDSADENRNILRQYIQKVGQLKANNSPNWSLLPFSTKATLVYESSPDAKAALPSGFEFIGPAAQPASAKYRIVFAGK